MPTQTDGFTAEVLRDGMQVQFKFVLVGKPYAQPRPTGKQGQRAYYSKRHLPAIAHRDRLVAHLRPYATMFPAGVLLGLDLRFYVAGSFGDGDNLEKLVLDALQAARVVTNDRQVRRLRWAIETLAASGRAEQATEVLVWQLAAC